MIPRSRLLYPGPRRIFQPEFPKVSRAFCWKAASVEILLDRLPVTAAGIQKGRDPGNPVRMVQAHVGQRVVNPRIDTIGHSHLPRPDAGNLPAGRNMFEEKVVAHRWFGGGSARQLFFAGYPKFGLDATDTGSGLVAADEDFVVTRLDHVLACF